MPDHANAGTDLAFSDPVDLLQGVPETTTSPVDQNSKDGLALRNRVIVDSTSERTSESDLSSVLTASGTNGVGKSVRTTTLKAIAVVSLMLSAWFGLNRPAIDSAAMLPAVAEMTADLTNQSPRWDSVAIQDVVTGQFVTVGLPDGESQPLPEDTLTEKALKQEATGVTEWLEYPSDDFVPYPIRIAVRDGVIVDVDGKDFKATLKNLISTKYVVGDADGTDLTRLLCRTIDLEMPKPDGSIAELSVIRPLWWLQGTGAAVGGSIDIALHEIGLSGEATVLAIGPCDVDSRETRPGMSIVTGTIRHRNATVWDLTFDGHTEETLGVTANHPLYSETRHAWIPAGDLQLDEVVRTLNGHSTLTARTQRPTRETVFNLEVHRSHAYHVSGLGVLAHNNNILECFRRPINYPSHKKVPIDLDHILDRHTAGGNTFHQTLRAGAPKDIFPSNWSKERIESAIRDAYRKADRIVGRKVYKDGPLVGQEILTLEADVKGRTIQMFFNKTTMSIESAWMKGNLGPFGY